MLRQTLKDLLKKNNLTQVYVAQRLGITQGALSLYLNGKRKISTQFLDRFCTTFDIDISEIYPQSKNDLGQIYIIGDVQAGYFKSLEESCSPSPLPICGQKDKKLPLFALRVKGDSMDKLYPDGSFLICCPLNAFPEKLSTGHKVICQRLHKDGKVEATVKEYTENKFGIFLIPHSTNPLYTPLKLEQSDTTIIINAVVVGSYHPEILFPF